MMMMVVVKVSFTHLQSVLRAETRRLPCAITVLGANAREVIKATLRQNSTWIYLCIFHLSNILLYRVDKSSIRIYPRKGRRQVSAGECDVVEATKEVDINPHLRSLERIQNPLSALLPGLKQWLIDLIRATFLGCNPSTTLVCSFLRRQRCRPAPVFKCHLNAQVSQMRESASSDSVS